MGQSNVPLSSALTSVRSMLDEPNPQEWSNTELTAWLNEGCVDIARRTETLLTTATIDVDAETQTYPAPNDMYRIYRIEYVMDNSPLMYPLQYRGLQGMDQYWGNLPSLPSAFPYLWTYWYSPVGADESGSPAPTQLTIKLYPVPASDGTMTVYYYRLVVPVALTTDTLDILPGWEDTAYDYTVYKALRKDADPRWKDQQALYEQKLAMMIDTTRRFTDQPDFLSTGPIGTPAWLLGGAGW
jgi:hypothetical protein